MNNRDAMKYAAEHSFAELYQKGREDAIDFVNEIISLCEDDGNDEVLKEVLCRKLLKYGFIRLVDDEYVLEQIKEQKDDTSD